MSHKNYTPIQELLPAILKKDGTWYDAARDHSFAAERQYSLSCASV